MAKGGLEAAQESSPRDRVGSSAKAVTRKVAQSEPTAVRKKPPRKRPKKDRSLVAWKSLLRIRDKKSKAANAQIIRVERVLQKVSDLAGETKRILAERLEACNADSGSAPDERYCTLADLTKRALTYMDKEASAALAAASELERVRKSVSNFTRATVEEINAITFDARMIVAREEARKERSTASKGERPAAATSLVNMFQAPDEEGEPKGPK